MIAALALGWQAAMGLRSRCIAASRSSAVISTLGLGAAGGGMGDALAVSGLASPLTRDVFCARRFAAPGTSSAVGGGGLRFSERSATFLVWPSIKTCQTPLSAS